MYYRSMRFNGRGGYARGEVVGSNHCGRDFHMKNHMTRGLWGLPQIKIYFLFFSPFFVISENSNRPYKSSAPLQIDL
jgi:hypothetical protein